MTALTRHICALAALPAEPPAEIELIPIGRFRLADQRGETEMRLDAASAAAVIASSLATAPGNVLPIDFDHRSFAAQGSADSRAAGWITAMRVEGGRIVATVDWTPDGRAALAGRSYRFVSPVFKARPDGEVVLIEGAGLVNNPALPELRQLASKELPMEPIERIAGALGIAADRPDDIVARVTALVTAEAHLASISTAAQVSGEDAVARICARLTAAAPDPASFVPKVAFDQLQHQFASLQGEVRSGRVDAALEKAREEGKLTPDLEAWATQLASKDLGEFEAWARVAPVRVELGRRQLAGRQSPVRAEALDETERQVASLMGVTEADFLATRNAAVKEG